MLKVVPTIDPGLELELDDPISEVRALRRLPGDLRVLVFGTDPALLWSVTRCLIRERYRPVVLAPHHLTPLRHQRSCTYVPLSDVHIDQGELEPQFLDRVEAACRTHEIDVVLPADLAAMRLVSRHGARIRSARIAAVPHAEALEHLIDRWHFTQTLAALGLPHPRTELVADATELRQTRLRFPILTRSRREPERVRRYDSMAALVAGLLEGELDPEFPLLAEELIASKPVGFLFLARHGQLLAHTAFEPRAPNAWRFFEARELRDHVAIWITALGYHGIGQIDAGYDSERHDYRLSCLRPSFSESLLFAERAGMNFPDLLTRMPEIGPGAGFMARPRPVSLSYYERGVAGMIRLAARAEALWSPTGTRIRD